MIRIKAQYSIEFILVFAFSLLIIIPIINLMHSEYNSNKETLDASQAKQVLDDISMAAQKTYYAGYPSRTTVEVFFPKGISQIYTNSSVIDGVLKTEFVFKGGPKNSESDIVSIFYFNVTASLKTTDGKRKILIKAEQADEKTLINITDAE